MPRQPMEADPYGVEWVRAAGGILWRRDTAGIEVLLVHRPRYDDWSFPKGKCDPGESDEACAAREVWEETGLRCVLGEELPTVRYLDHKRRPKVVRYWTMTVAEETPWEPGDEVDGLAWVALAAAGARLSYRHDAELLAELHPG